MRFVASFVAICAAGACAAQLASWVPVCPLALVEHFRVQLFAGGVLVVAACAAVRSRWLDAAALASLLHLLWLVPDLVRSARPLPTPGRPVRVLLLNVHTSSTTYADVRRLIADEQPDVVALLEVDQRWLHELSPALAAYPSRIEHPRDDNFGVALYARERVVGGVEMTALLPSIVAELSVAEGTPLGLILTHPIPPVDGDLLHRMTEHFDDVAARARTLGPLVMVLGDFNATPWSRPYRRLVEASRLCDTRDGFGLHATFPASFAPLRIPIDHALVTCTIGVRDRRVARDVGSDHLPVVLDLVLPR